MAQIERNTRKIIEDLPASLAAPAFAKIFGTITPGENIFAKADWLDAEPGARLPVVLFSTFGKEVLEAVETHAERIVELAEGNGVQSLKTIIGQTVTEEEHILFEKQLDELCRSCWAFTNLEVAFQNAESFNQARQDRDRGNICSNFALDIPEDIEATADSVDEAALTEKLRSVLDLRHDPKLTAIDLSATEEHPSSVMLIVRHGGDLSSVYVHTEEGSRQSLYYRPQDEITLIYTPAKRLIEVLGMSFGHRHELSNAFAELVLGQNVSE
ncbi:hypothetical protein DU478_21515 [Thalassococcus profundi]|uniref:Uncharacterized protein n=1 Tax=Thalassococcus profundi TaxID=2282382 RepID=A0A369THT8_9RHOB|nr:hypothetical protein [Thalassococcus profundi]RDD64194.1 hypothetical protein DU478_21515 [Thalassococcus profundi]